MIQVRLGRTRIFRAGAAFCCFVFALLASSGHVQRAQTHIRIGMPHDWTHHHVIFSNPTTPELTRAVLLDTRYWHQRFRMQSETNRPDTEGESDADGNEDGDRNRDLDGEADRDRRHSKTRRVDWSVNLGSVASSVAPGMYPAKYTFDVNAAASCAKDFVIFALNIAGSNTQANLVAYNNLYTEPGGTGLCPGTGPTVMWAYDEGPAITTSPVLSTDGTKVAWATSNAGSSVFHVLTIGTTGSNGTSLTSPAVPGVGNNANDAAVSYGTTGNTRSSIFVDYTRDAGYVGSDDGLVHKFSTVFGGTPTEVMTRWPILNNLGTHVAMTSPVFDSVSHNIYIGDAQGNLTYIRDIGSTVGSCASGITLPCAGSGGDSLTASLHPLVDPPVVDSTAQKVFAFVGSDNAGASAFVAQVDLNLMTNLRTPTMGKAGKNFHLGAFDNNYYSSPTSGFLYVCGHSTLDSNATLYRIGFDFSGNIMFSHDSNSLALTIVLGGTECSPMTEIFNTPAGRDRLFVSVQNGCIADLAFDGCLLSFDITSGFPSAVAHFQREAGGTSGIVIDNVSTAAQASSLYFTTLGSTTCGDGVSGNPCAVKLTQSALQ
jgi:hypothetical protein